MFRIILSILVVVMSFNVSASYQTSSTKQQKEFELIESRFENVKPLIVKVAKERGVHAGTLTTTIYRESKFDVKIGKNKTSSAHSIVQMTMPTKRYLLKLYGDQLGIPKNADLNNPKYAVTLAAVYFNHIENHLTKQLKRKPTNAEVALGYRFGEGAAVTMIKKKSTTGYRWMDSFRKDAAFYGAKVNTPENKDTYQLAFAENKTVIDVTELQAVWSTIYKPTFNALVTINSNLKGALL